MLSACAKAVCRVYVRISLPTVVRLAPRPPTARIYCASSIGAELVDMDRLDALKAFVQWSNRMGVIRGSRTRDGTLPANRGASAAAVPTASAAPPAHRVLGETARSWGRSVPARRWRAFPHHCKPLPCMRCRSRRRHWRRPPPKPPLAWWWGGGGGGGGLALVAVPRLNRDLGGE